MEAKIDLYNYKDRLKRKLESIKGLESISKGAKGKILKFQRDRIAEGIGHARILRYLDDLPKLALLLDKEFKDASQDRSWKWFCQVPPPKHQSDVEDM